MYSPLTPYGRQKIITSGTVDLQLHHSLQAKISSKFNSQVEMPSTFQANALVDRHHKQVENKQGYDQTVR